MELKIIFQSGQNVLPPFGVRCVAEFDGNRRFFTLHERDMDRGNLGTVRIEVGETSTIMGPIPKFWERAAEPES